MAQRFLIVHGWGGSGPDHWQTWLIGRLQARGECVLAPELPDPEQPRPDEWHAGLTRALGELSGGEGERVVVCHSLGSILWLRHTRLIEPSQRVSRVLLVAPAQGAELVPSMAGFFPVQTDPESVAAAAERTLMVGSDDDPYCPDGQLAVYGEPLGIETEMIPGGGHLNDDAGYGPWPHVEAWCLGLRSGVAW